MDDMQNLEDTGEERGKGGKNNEEEDDDEGAAEEAGEGDGAGEGGDGLNDGDADGVDLLDFGTTEPGGTAVGGYEAGQAEQQQGLGLSGLTGETLTDQACRVLQFHT